RETSNHRTKTRRPELDRRSNVGPRPERGASLQSLCNDGDWPSGARRNEEGTRRWNREKERIVVEEKREEGRGLEATDLLPGGLGQAHKVVLTRHGPPAGQDPAREGKQQKKEKTSTHRGTNTGRTERGRRKRTRQEKRKPGSVPV
ncbi:hypothetical protein K0M31_007569, partial [Melipona bicolor]